MSGKVGFISLDYPRALVGSERILTQLCPRGYEVAPRYNDTDLVVVHIGGANDKAKALALEMLLEEVDVASVIARSREGAPETDGLMFQWGKRPEGRPATDTQYRARQRTRSMAYFGTCQQLIP